MDAVVCRRHRRVGCPSARCTRTISSARCSKQSRSSGAPPPRVPLSCPSTGVGLLQRATHRWDGRNTTAHSDESQISDQQHTLDAATLCPQTACTRIDANTRDASRVTRKRATRAAETCRSETQRTQYCTTYRDSSTCEAQEPNEGGVDTLRSNTSQLPADEERDSAERCAGLEQHAID